MSSHRGRDEILQGLFYEGTDPIQEGRAHLLIPSLGLEFQHGTLGDTETLAAAIFLLKIYKGVAGH
jgi:hypothetical protein